MTAAPAAETASVADGVNPSPAGSRSARARHLRLVVGQRRARETGQLRRDAPARRSPWSERNLRISVTSFCRAPTSAIAAPASLSASAPARWADGQAAITTDSPPVSSVQSTSVTKGTTGCRRRRTTSSTSPRTRRVTSASRPPPAQHELGQLQVPVAELVPDEVVQRLGGAGELEVLVGLVDLPGDRGEPGEDPAVHDGLLLRCRQLAADRGAVEQREAGGVPELRAEVAAALDPLVADRHVGAGVGAAGEGEAQRVGAVGVHEVERVDGRCPWTSLIFRPNLSRTSPVSATVRNGSTPSMA